MAPYPLQGRRAARSIFCAALMLALAAGPSLAQRLGGGGMVGGGGMGGGGVAGGPRPVPPAGAALPMPDAPVPPRPTPPPAATVPSPAGTGGSNETMGVGGGSICHIACELCYDAETCRRRNEQTTR